jgi:hypothetical protein
MLMFLYRPPAWAAHPVDYSKFRRLARTGSGADLMNQLWRYFRQQEQPYWLVNNVLCCHAKSIYYVDTQ